MLSSALRVRFPQNVVGNLDRVRDATLRLREFEHEMFVVDVYGHSKDTLGLRTGDPAEAALRAGGGTRQFVGYVHHVQDLLSGTGSNRRHRIFLIGPTFRMKDAEQRVYRNKTVSEIALEILAEHGLTADVEPHSHRFRTLTQPGISDWEMLCKIAKMVGYVVWAEGTVVHVHRRNRNEAETNRAAELLPFHDATRAVPGRPGMRKFQPQVSDTMPGAAAKGRKGLWTVDPRSGQIYASSDMGRPDRTSRRDSKEGFLRQFPTLTPDTPAEAAVLLKGQAELSRLNVTAVAEGTDLPLDLNPTSSVYLQDVPSEYEGFWRVTGVDHRVSVDYYNTTLHLGTDSLGKSTVPAPPANRPATTASLGAKRSKSILVVKGGQPFWRGSTAKVSATAPAAAPSGRRRSVAR